MSELTPEQKKALEEQKKQCPFCKIISGEITAKKAYEDPQVTAILDINPLTDGHSLLLPKEHYPIMPLITQPDFVKLFRVVKDYAMAQKRSLLKTGVTVFIANGAAAGQISPHFMIHMIPREKGDNIGIFKVVGKEAGPDPEIEKVLSHNLPIMMENHLARHKEEWHKPKALKEGYTKEEVIALIEKNPQLKDFIVKNPEEFAKQAVNNDQLKNIFASVDMHEIIQHFNPRYKVKDAEIVEEKATTIEKTKEKPGQDNEGQPEDKPQEGSDGEELHKMTKDEVIEAIQESPKALKLIKENPEEFIVKAQENEKLSRMFADVDINEVIKHFNPDFGKEHEKEDKPSLDDITGLL